VNQCCFIFDKINKELTIQPIVYTVKSFEKAKEDYLKSRMSLDNLVKSLKDYPKSLEALTSDFWNQFFTEHHVILPTLDKINYIEEFKIQNMLKFFNQLPSSVTCKKCYQQSACKGGKMCLTCKHNSCLAFEEECNVNEVNMDTFLKHVSPELTMQLITRCGVMPITLEEFKKHNTMTGVCRVIVNQHVITLFQKERLCDIKFQDDESMAHFLRQHFGVTMFY